MIYVMECGPVSLRDRECWLAFSFDLLTRQTKTRVANDRDQARHEVASALGGARASCCAALGDFGRQRGWRVESPPEEVLELAALTLVGMENEAALGMLAYSPVAEAWLRSCAMFMDARPWEQFTSHEPLAVTFHGPAPGTSVLAIGGAGSLPPSLAMLPDRAAFDRVQQGGRDLTDALLLGLEVRPGPVSASVGLAFGEAVHPVVLRLRRGKPRLVKEAELHRLAAALAAIASLASGRPVGRAVVGELEAVVVPLASHDELRS